jgi:hypothetical protein
MQKLFDESLKVEPESVYTTLKKEIPTTEKIGKSENLDVPAPVDGSGVEKIVWFYRNNSFREYFPDKQKK